MDVCTTSPPEDFAEGEIVGEYRIERKIGSGGMGTVYGARHPVIGKRAAIKVLSAKSSADQEAVSRFVLEAQAVNRIGHANIVDIFAFGSLPDGRSYFVMEWLQGENLQDRLDRFDARRERLPIADQIAILVALTRALEAAHAAGVIHRDLKPENVFLTPEDDGFRVKLLDFGIAKLSGPKPIASRTATGMTVGTPLFMSPEQARGLDIDERTDLYSLGVVAYAMATGRTPFEDESSPVEVLNAHIKRVPDPPSMLAPEVPAELEAVILALLAKHADKRPSLIEVRRRVQTSESAISQPSLAAVPRRRWLGWAIAGGVAAAGAAVVAFAFAASSDAESAPAPPVVIVKTAPVKPPPPPAPAPAPAPEPMFAGGAIDLSVAPATATATVDDTAITFDHGRAHVELAPGPHELVVSAPGFQPQHRSIDIASENLSGIDIKLVRTAGRIVRPPRTPVRTPKPDTDAVVNPFAKKKP